MTDQRVDDPMFLRPFRPRFPQIRRAAGKETPRVQPPPRRTVRCISDQAEAWVVMGLLFVVLVALCFVRGEVLRRVTAPSGPSGGGPSGSLNRSWPRARAASRVVQPRLDPGSPACARHLFHGMGLCPPGVGDEALALPTGAKCKGDSERRPAPIPALTARAARAHTSTRSGRAERRSVADHGVNVGDSRGASD